MRFNRRQLTVGAAALLCDTHLSLAFAALSKTDARDSSSESLGGPPKDLLSSTFTPSVLSKSLLSASVWHPYPKVDDRDAWQKVPRDTANTIIQRAEAGLGLEWTLIPATVLLEFKRSGNRNHFEHFYFLRRQRLTDLVLGECVEGKGRFLDEIVNGVWLTCEESFWGISADLYLQKVGAGLPDVTEPVVSLFAPETAATLAWIDYLLGARLDQVSPLIRPRIRIEAKRRILDPALDRNDFAWMGLDGKGGRLNNGTPWINSTWMVTNLLLEQDPARRLSAMSKMCRSLDRYLSDYSPDGACEEGRGYWEVSAGGYFDCCATLASATGGVVNVLTNPFIKKMGRYIVDVHIADDYYVNYGDAQAKGGAPPELIYLFGSGTEDKVLEAFGAFSFHAQHDAVSTNNGAGHLARELPDVMRATEIESAPKVDALERDAWYPSLGLMTARAKAGTSDGFYLAVQAARNNRSHGHNDSGSFIVFHDGEPVFIDPGVEAYTAKSFGPERDTLWTTQSAYHNLPTVDGVMQHGRLDQYRASDLRYASDDASAALSMNLATAYPVEAGIQHWLRDIALERKTGLIRLTEEFKLQRKMPVMLSFMTPRIPSKESSGSILLSTAQKTAKDVSLKYDATLMSASVEKIELKGGLLEHIWGANIYRVLLTSPQPTDGGKWTIEIS